MNWIKLTAVLGCCMGFAACASKPQPEPSPAAQAKLLIQQRAALEVRLNRYGAQVVNSGRHYDIIMQTQGLFDGLSANPVFSFDTRLDAIADYLKTFHIVAVQVVSTMPCFVASPRVLQAMTASQAGQVVRGLSSRGLDVRLITAEGTHGAAPASVHCSSQPSVEVQFEKNKA